MTNLGILYYAGQVSCSNSNTRFAVLVLLGLMMDRGHSLWADQLVCLDLDPGRAYAAFARWIGK